MQLQGEVLENFNSILNLIEKEIPLQGKNLSDNVVNLEKVAQYCEDIYVNSKEANKQYFLNETKGYTNQALASVAYQIHVLSNSFLQLLENQSAIINDMTVSMSHLSHDVNIHKEKVARREIGMLTTNRTATRTLKVKRPDVDEKPVKYVRKPIDYSILDDIGHGVKLKRSSYNPDPLLKIGVGRQNSYTSTHSSSGMNTSIGPNGKPPDVPTTPLISKAPNPILNINPGNGLGTIRSNASSGSYYSRAPVAPPSVPSEYLSRQELGIYSSKKELNQSAGSDSLSAAYGYRRQQSNSSNMNNTIINNMSNTNEYSGTDTLDRRITNTYLNQYNYASNVSQINNNNNGNTVGYSSTKELGIIRTNLNNIDYSANGTMYRRPQLNPSIYERSIPVQDQTEQRIQSNQYSQRLTSQSNNNTSILSNNSMHTGLPPPPPPILFDHSVHQQNSSQIDNIENEIFGHDYDSREDDDIIPNWVPIDRCLEKVITTYDYEGLREDELSFKENMYIYVIKKNDDHWYEGIMKTENGDIIQGISLIHL